MNTENLEQLLEGLLDKGRQYAEKGQQVAEQKLNIPNAGPEREVMLDGLKKGAIASAVLVGLLGTKGGRSLTGTAIKLGGLAAIGAAAFQGYKVWQGDGQAQVNAKVQDQVRSESETEASAKVIIQTMVAAANADGKVDDAEQSTIKHEILHMHLDDDLAAELSTIIDQPLSVKELSALVDSELLASEVYLAARLLIDEHSSLAEKEFLEELVVALGLSHELCAELDQQVS